MMALVAMDMRSSRRPTRLLRIFKDDCCFLGTYGFPKLLLALGEISF